MAEAKPNKKEKPGYLIFTPVEELIDDGIRFIGDTDKDKTINLFDFSRTRELIQRFGTQVTPDQNETLVRYLKLCIDPETLK